MSKPRLGKGLGQLMNGDGVAGKEASPLPSPTPRGRGFNTLLKDAERPRANVAPPQNVERAPALPDWFFFTADLLILGFTVAVVFVSRKPLTPSDVLFCSVAVTVAAILGLVPFVREQG